MLLARWGLAKRLLESDALVVVAVLGERLPPLQLWEYSFLIQFAAAADRGYDVPPVRLATLAEMDFLEYGFFRGAAGATLGDCRAANYLKYRAEVDRMDCCLDSVD